MQNLLLFVVVFLFVANWFQLTTIFTALLGRRVSKIKIKDEWIYKTVFTKTGLRLLEITLFKDERMYGMMAGLPFWPKMILSEGLYKSLSKDELEWVILHEAGHCVLWHNLGAFTIQVFSLCIGIYIIDFFNIGSISSVALSVAISLVCIQIFRRFLEYEADKFSIDRVNNPTSVITAQDKFRKANHKNPFSSEKSPGRFFLHWNIYPSQRIRMAKQRISKGKPPII